jgi:hypothetical protein
VDRFLLKTWLAERKTEFNLAPGPHLELYPLKLSTWPPQDKDLTIGHLTATLCIPIAPAPLPPEEPAKEEISSDESSLSNDE